MSLQTPGMENASLGKYLQETRDNQGLSLWTVADETKISLRNLQAIENDDFSALPAEAFTRGIYTLYARALSLDPGQILHQYTQQRPARKHGLGSQTASGHAHDVGLMAERPSSLHLATFGLALFCLLLAGGFFCWYFSWNPATYLSQQLRSLDESSPAIEDTTSTHSVPVVPDPLSYFRSTAKNKSEVYDLFTLPAPSTATAAVSEPPVQAGITPSKTQIPAVADSSSQKR